jgi:CRISPR-associated endonuclease/helicase Cas3
MMYCSPWAQEPLLAKSINQPISRAARERIRKMAGYPKHGRHELLSVHLLESAPGLLPDEEKQQELALHLIASHHGYCRPFAPIVNDANPCAVTLELDGHTLSATSDTHLEQLDSGVSDRYWRLTCRYGWWGLAWLETILRLADHRASEAEEAEESDQEDDEA